MLNTKHQSSRFPFSEKKNFEVSFLVPMYKLVTPPGGVSFDPQEHHMNEHGKGPGGDATYRISKLYAFQFQRRKVLSLPFFFIYLFIYLFIFFFFFCSYVPICDLGTSYELTLVEVHFEIIHITYQSLTPYSFRENEFLSFLL